MVTYKHTVQYYETDKMGITHHSNYIRFMEEARIHFLNSIGQGYDKLEREGVISPVVSVSCNYKRPTTFPDEIYIKVKLSEVSQAKFSLEYIMSVNEKTVCTAESTHCFVSESGRPINIAKNYPALYEILCSLKED